MKSKDFGGWIGQKRQNVEKKIEIGEKDGRAGTGSLL